MNLPKEADKKRKLEGVPGEEPDVPTAKSNKPAAVSSGTELKPASAPAAPAAPARDSKLGQLHRSFIAALQPPVSYERYNTAALADEAKRCPSILTMLHLGCGDGALTSNLATELGASLTGLDPRQSFVQQAQQTHSNAKFELIYSRVIPRGPISPTATTTTTTTTTSPTTTTTTTSCQDSTLPASSAAEQEGLDTNHRKTAALFDCALLDLDAFSDTELTPEQLLEITYSQLTVGGTALVRGRCADRHSAVGLAYSDLEALITKLGFELTSIYKDHEQVCIEKQPTEPSWYLYAVAIKSSA